MPTVLNVSPCPIPAVQVARDEFCESTVGYTDAGNGAAFQSMLDCPTFRVGRCNGCPFGVTVARWCNGRRNGCPTFCVCGRNGI